MRKQLDQIGADADAFSLNYHIVDITDERLRNNWEALTGEIHNLVQKFELATKQLEGTPEQLKEPLTQKISKLPSR